MGHVTALLDYSMDRAVRCCLLRLLESLLAPEGSRQDEKAGRVAAANGRAFVEAGGVQLAVDFVASTTSTHSITLAVAHSCVLFCSQCFACYLYLCMIFLMPKSVADSACDTMQFHAAVKVTRELLSKTDCIIIVSQKDGRQDGQISYVTLVIAQSSVHNASPNKLLQCGQAYVGHYIEAV